MQKMKENFCSRKKANENCGCRIGFVFRFFYFCTVQMGWSIPVPCEGTINLRFKRNIYGNSFVITYLLKIFYEFYGRNGGYNDTISCKKVYNAL